MKNLFLKIKRLLKSAKPAAPIKRQEGQNFLEAAADQFSEDVVEDSSMGVVVVHDATCNKYFPMYKGRYIVYWEHNGTTELLSASASDYRKGFNSFEHANEVAERYRMILRGPVLTVVDDNLAPMRFHPK